MTNKRKNTTAMAMATMAPVVRRWQEELYVARLRREPFKSVRCVRESRIGRKSKGAILAFRDGYLWVFQYCASNSHDPKVDRLNILGKVGVAVRGQTWRGVACLLYALSSTNNNGVKDSE